VDGTRLGTSYQIEPDHEEETGFHERGRKKKGSEKRKKQDFMREEERKKGLKRGRNLLATIGQPHLSVGMSQQVRLFNYGCQGEPTHREPAPLHVLHSFLPWCRHSAPTPWPRPMELAKQNEMATLKAATSDGSGLVGRRRTAAPRCWSLASTVRRLCCFFSK